MNGVRSPLAITLSVWRAVFLREAVDRLFDMRAAWLWLLLEPVFHIAFIAFVFSVIRLRSAGGMDIVVWIIVGMLTFFVFRRTAMQVMYAPESNRPLFVYRQVKPFDTAIARAALEAFLMAVVALLIFAGAAFLGHDMLPVDPLLTVVAAGGLGLLGLGYGLVASALMAILPETEHILKLLMMPLYLISGVIWPLSAIPQPWRDALMMNPLAHGLELARAGFFPYYHAANGVDLGYLAAWALASLLLGLLLYRRFARQLVMR